MKSHTSECAKTETARGNLGSHMKTYYFCVQDFATKDHPLVVHGRSITITQQQLDDGTWQEIVKQALQ